MNPDDYRYHVEKLPNGLRLAWLNVPHARTVHFTALVRGGCLYETKENNGVSHLLEHLHMSTSKKYPTREAMTEAIGRMGYANAMTTQEYMEFQVGALPDRLSVANELMAEILASREFEKTDIELEKALILDEIRSSSERHGGHPLVEFLYATKGPLQYSAGTTKSVNQLDIPRIRRFDRDAFRPREMVVGVTGPLDTGSVHAIQSTLGDLEEDRNELLHSSIPKLRLLPIVAWSSRIVSKNGVYIGFIHRGLFSQVDWVCASFLCQSLFSSPSPLFNRLRYGITNTYNRYCDLSTLIGNMLVDIAADTHVRQRNPFVQEVLETLRDFREGRLDPRWFAAMRDQGRYGFASVLDDPAWLSGRIAQAEFYYANGRGEDLAEEIDAVLNLTLDQFQDFARRLFRPENAFILLGSKSWRCAPRHFRGIIEKYLG